MTFEAKSPKLNHFQLNPEPQVQYKGAKKDGLTMDLDKTRNLNALKTVNLNPNS